MLELVEIDPRQRKDPAARAECLRTSDVAVLCLPDDASREAVTLVGDAPTLADVACYAYIAHAPEGGVSLAAYPDIRRWLAAVESLPGFVPMQATAAGLQAA